MRGKDGSRTLLNILNGITPAYAGKRCRCQFAQPWHRDHPRVCGEKADSGSHLHFRIGSPPRMRGKVDVDLKTAQGVRITPTYAGKRYSERGTGRKGQDHPRVCGKKLKAKAVGAMASGSPPRMRGKVLAALMPENRVRITPAYAGKSVRLFGLQGSGRDHPRVCGEKLKAKAVGAMASGSPPRMRGKGKRVLQNLERVGITPAYAGKRHTAWTVCRSQKDHPRVCGEKCQTSEKPPVRPGSPPRMRGKAVKARSWPISRGITPAYAGKSSFQAGTVSASRDHPRVCGEKM